MKQEILERLGFTHGEVKVYLSLIRLGNVTSGPIVDDSGISKSKVYEILERLTKKGVVSQVTEEGVKHFQAVDPKRLLDLYNEKEKEMENVKKNLLDFIPQLEIQFNSKKERQEVNVLKGNKGIKSVFKDIINTLESDDEYIVFCAVEPPDNFKQFIDKFSKERINKKIKHKIIFSEQVPKKHIEKSRKYKYTQVKTISPEFNTPAVFNLYSNKIAIILWSEDPIAIVIENQEIANSFKQYFNLIWKISK